MAIADADRKIDRIVSAIEQIPTLPIVRSHIQSLFNDNDVSLKKLEEIIERDPPLAIKLLKLVNSSFYGLLNKISSIEHALVILGFNEVRNVVLGFSLQNQFQHTNAFFDPKQFWRHSIICSQIAKYLGKHFNTVDDGTFFLSGLIHDIGKLVIEQYFPDEFSRIIEYISRHNSTFSQAEKEIIGVTHYQISAKLLQQWHFPRRVVMQVFYHHAPWHDKNFSSGSTVIYLSNMLAKLTGYYCFSDEHKISLTTCLNSSVCEYLNKNGFELDAESLSLLQASIAEFIAAEHDKVLRLFD
jgi:putative nucleotidyltransferase with HDIG domain